MKQLSLRDDLGRSSEVDSCFTLQLIIDLLWIRGAVFKLKRFSINVTFLDVQCTLEALKFNMLYQSSWVEANGLRLDMR